MFFEVLVLMIEQGLLVFIPPKASYWL